MNFVDTSVVVPALVATHEAHDIAHRVATGTQVVAHARLEAHSVLTRMPSPYRLEGSTASPILDSWFPVDRVAVPSAALSTGVVGTLADAAIDGGAAYDGLIALTVAEDGGVLLSRDGRAIDVYERVGVERRLIA